MASFQSNLIYYVGSACLFGVIGTVVGCTIAQDLGEVIYSGEPSEPQGHFFSVLDGAAGSSGPTVESYTQAGRLWVGGGAGIGALFGLLLVLICSEDNRNSVKNMFMSMFGRKLNNAQLNQQTESRLLPPSRHLID